MERKELKKILNKYYSEDSIKSVLAGRMRPSYETMYNLNLKHNIPFTAWQDIKSFLSVESVTNNKNKSKHHKEGKMS